MKKDNPIRFGKIKRFELYVPHYTQLILQQAIISIQILTKVPTELQYVERDAFVKAVHTQNSWTFEKGTQEDINVPIWITVGFPQRDRHDSQNLKNDTF